jgi:regulatory protein
MKNQKSYTVNEATKALEYFCAYQERCHKEVEKKLISIKMIPEARDHIILHLLQNNFLNEERFSKAFARGKFSIKKWGKIRITNELKFRDISVYNINSALNEINDDDYIDTLNTIAEKKIPLIKDTNKYTKKNKLSTYLMSKGYESHLAYKVVNELIK